MPWHVYTLLVAWLVFGAWNLAKTKQKLDRLPEVYLEPDLLLKFFKGELPREQQRLMTQYAVVLLGSLMLLAIAILWMMVAEVDG